VDVGLVVALVSGIVAPLLFWGWLRYHRRDDPSVPLGWTGHVVILKNGKGSGERHEIVDHRGGTITVDGVFVERAEPSSTFTGEIREPSGDHD
jgi:hypothetical protein